jgi:ribonuclease BN (tRNA processing enzyme)
VSPLSITVLGCSGTYAGPGTACTGYLVSVDGRHIWLDAGPGTLAALQEHVALADVDAIVLTHSHPDHWLELPVARNALKYLFGREGMPVLGTAETRAMAEAVCGRLDPTFEWTTIVDGSDLEVAGARLRCSRTDHPVETLAVRIDHGGRSLAFSADTGADWSVATLGNSLDLFVCEASLARADEGRTQHLSAAQAGSMARSAGVSRLVITHLVPGVDPASQHADAVAAFGGPVEVAHAHATYDV